MLGGGGGGGGWGGGGGGEFRSLFFSIPNLFIFSINMQVDIHAMHRPTCQY